MDFISLDQYCKDCDAWFHKSDRKLKRKLIQTPNGNFAEIIYCPNCESESILWDAAEYGMQTPYQKEVCKIMEGEIRMHEGRIHELEERIRRNGGEI